MRLSPVILVLALAGCASTPAPEAEAPCLVEAADDYSCLEEDVGRSPDQVAHQHDYWRGQDRVLLMEQTQSGGGLISNCAPWDWYTFRPEAPQTVYQGTAQLEIAVELTDSADSFYSNPQLWVKTAMDDAPWFFADLTGSDRFVMESNNSANDLPHDRISSWEFHLFIEPGDPMDPFCHTRFTGTMDMTVEIVRGLEIPLYPGHPDRWDNRTQIEILSQGRTIDFYRGGTGGSCLGISGSCLWDPHLPDDGVVVPHDARDMVVKLTNDGPLPLQLLYHGADTRDLTDPDLTVGPGEEAELEIEVGAQGDGPYARQSLWEFWVIPDHPTQLYHGAYSLSVVVHRE